MSPQIPTITEQKFLALAPKIPAAISFVMSSAVIWSFYRNERKRKRLYHRLVFVMSCYGILFSLAMGLGTSLFPSDTSDSYGALGNKATCNFQGIIVQLTLAVPLYYASLSVYCYVAINSDFKDKDIVWIEPWIHGTIHTYTVLSSIFMVVTDNINPSGTVCWIGTMPILCGDGTDVPCERGDAKKVRMYILLLLVLPVYGMIITSSILMIMVYNSQKNMDISQFRGKQEILQRAKRRKTKIIALQGSLYFGAFVLAYTSPIIYRSMLLFTKKQHFIAFGIGSILVSFQSTFFTLVYFGLQIKIAPEYPLRDNINYCATLSRRISEYQLDNKKSEEFSGEQTVRRVSFSIFDGSMISSSPWSQFLFDDVLEDEDEEENDIVPDERENQSIHSETTSIGLTNQTISD